MIDLKVYNSDELDDQKVVLVEDLKEYLKGISSRLRNFRNEVDGNIIQIDFFHEEDEIDIFDEDSDISPASFEVVFRKYDKIDLGGYKDLDSGVEYTNNFCQTDLESKVIPVLNERHTQTIEVSTKSHNPKREFGCQTAKENELFIDERNDKVIVPGRYFDSNLWMKRRIQATIYIQKVARRYLARKRMRLIFGIHQRLLSYKNKLELENKNSKEMFLIEEIERRLKPKVPLLEH